MTRYLLDSNIFIQSCNFEYRFTFCSGFWDLLSSLHKMGIVFSISSVKKELTKKDDELAKWIKLLPDTFFCNERVIAQAKYAHLMNWAMVNSQFNDYAKQKFASEHADPWLVAYAAEQDMEIITHEVYDPYIKKAIKIPNAAKELGVKCVRLYDFLELVAENNFKIKQPMMVP